MIADLKPYSEHKASSDTTATELIAETLDQDGNLEEAEAEEM